MISNCTCTDLCTRKMWLWSGNLEFYFNFILTTNCTVHEKVVAFQVLVAPAPNAAVVNVMEEEPPVPASMYTMSNNQDLFSSNFSTKNNNNDDDDNYCVIRIGFRIRPEDCTLLGWLFSSRLWYKHLWSHSGCYLAGLSRNCQSQAYFVRERVGWGCFLPSQNNPNWRVDELPDLTNGWKEIIFICIVE